MPRAKISLALFCDTPQKRWHSDVHVAEFYSWLNFVVYQGIDVFFGN
jgi:homoserine trans-succinylase